MADYFGQGSPKLSASYKRQSRPSARNRSLGLLLALVIVVALYFYGCNGVPEIPH